MQQRSMFINIGIQGTLYASKTHLVHTNIQLYKLIFFCLIWHAENDIKFIENLNDKQINVNKIHIGSYYSNITE